MILSYDTRRMGELLQSFYRLTKIRIVMFNTAFEKVAEAPGYDSAFCRLIRSCPQAEEECHACDQRACEECRESNSLHTYTCHAGLTETVAPVRYGNLIIGYLMFGQILQQADADAHWRQVKAATGGYGIDEAALYAAYKKKRPVKPEQVQAAATILEACAGYLWLERSLSLQEDSLPARLEEYISENLGADLSVAALCRRFSVSRSKLYRVAREYFGCGLEQMTRALRIAKARDLLENTARPVSEVACQVGYGDYNYFIKVFKKETGLTPGSYRNHQSANR